MTQAANNEAAALDALLAELLAADGIDPAAAAEAAPADRKFYLFECTVCAGAGTFNRRLRGGRRSTCTCGACGGRGFGEWIEAR